jgi:hypothetical protein
VPTIPKGFKSGYLTILGFELKRPKGKIWKAECVCKKIRFYAYDEIMEGKKLSCGCKQYNPHIKYDGKPVTFDVLSKLTGIKKSTLIMRRLRGWKDEDIIGKNTRKERKFNYNQKSKTIKEWSKITNLPIKLIYKRLNAGWSVSKTLSTTPRPARK